jgi:hypothetical protein
MRLFFFQHREYGFFLKSRIPRTLRVRDPYDYETLNIKPSFFPEPEDHRCYMVPLLRFGIAEKSRASRFQKKAMLRAFRTKQKSI